MSNSVAVEPFGDRAVLIRVPSEPDGVSPAWVNAVCMALEEGIHPALVEWVPGWASVTVHYDPLRTSGLREGWASEELAAAIRQRLGDITSSAPPPGELVEIPCCYEAEFGPDLEAVARRAQRTVEEVIDLHTRPEYTVRMLGFVPGFAYLDGLDAAIATPRRAVPRTSVPAGSAAIGGTQTGVYPIASPGGWQLIGRTPVRLFLPERTVPVRLRLWDRVRFRAISREEYGRLQEDAPAKEDAVARDTPK